MHELRLIYQFETGIKVDPIIQLNEIADIEYDPESSDAPELDLSQWYTVKEYIEWLEEKALMDDAIVAFFNKILHEKNKT